MEELKAKAYDIIAAIYARQAEITALNSTLQGVQEEIDRLQKLQVNEEVKPLADTDQSPPPKN